ncbi:MAG: hypothetical protein HZC54_00740 [Verrucomicrobia bacterium]|nr:hypothetical protein [Verrucomicrobiota bacterium]
MSDADVVALTGHRPAAQPAAPDGGGGAGNPQPPAQGPASAGQPSGAGAAQPPATGGPASVEIEPGLVVELPADIAGSLAGLGEEAPAAGGAAAAAAGAAAGGDGAAAPVDDAARAANVLKKLKPTGSETPEQIEANAVRELVQSEKFKGQQAEKLGAVRQIAEALTKTYLPLFELDGDGKPVRLSLKNVQAAIGKEEVERQLAELGVKLVPVHAAEGGDGATVLRAIKEQVADTLIPGKELNAAQKLQTLKTQMETDPDLREKFEEAVSEARFNRQLEAAAKLQAEKQERERQQQRIAQETDRALEQFEKLPHKDGLRPVMASWAKRLDGQPLVGALRIEVLRKVAEAETLKPRVQQTYRSGFLAGLKHRGQVAAGTLPGEGAPAAITGAGGGAEGGLGITPEAATRGFA